MQSATAAESISRKKTALGMEIQIVNIEKFETVTCRGRKGRVKKTQIKSMSVKGLRKVKANQLKWSLPCGLSFSFWSEAAIKFSCTSHKSDKTVSYAYHFQTFSYAAFP